MNGYNPKIHHRRSIRLKGYDYSQAGLYFVTICVQDKINLFGDIQNGEMVLNNAGEMVKKWYKELENKFPDIKNHEMVIMPNHFHCIIENIGNTPVGADLCVCPKNKNNPNNKINPNNNSKRNSITERIEGEHIGSPLHLVVQWFKTMTTNEYIQNVKLNNWKRFNGKLWQRNYWEHIIQNEKSHKNISEYIINNPLNWNSDKLNSQNN